MTSALLKEELLFLISAELAIYKNDQLDLKQRNDRKTSPSNHDVGSPYRRREGQQ
jgi:hypothetical protein